MDKLNLHEPYVAGARGIYSCRMNRPLLPAIAAALVWYGASAGLPHFGASVPPRIRCGTDQTPSETALIAAPNELVHRHAGLSWQPVGGYERSL